MTAEQYKTDALPVPEQGTASYRNIHLLFKKLPHGEEIHNIFPVTYTQSVYDGKTGANLEHILHLFNHIFLQFLGTPLATRNLLPKDMRRKGIMISYRNMDNNVVTETNIDESESTSDNWGLDKYWAVYSISLDLIIKVIEDYIDLFFDDALKEYLESLITEVVKLNPDDLDKNSDNQIQLADRDSTNGMGYVILRKNKTFAEQVTKENTIYEIRYDYDLDGGEVTIPANCIIDCEGGALNNGTFICNNTLFRHRNNGTVILSGTYEYEIPEEQELEIATETTLGGIKAEAKTDNETVEVKIDSSTGKLYTKSGNNPDNEDLHLVELEDKQVLQFADKEYNSDSFSGLGRVYLRKNISSGKNVLTQEMMSKANTQYIIQYDYDLNGETITVPANCVLKFEGGSLSNGSIEGTETNIIADYMIFDEITVSGTYCILNIYLSWFKISKDDDCLNSLLNCIRLSNSSIFSTVHLNKEISIKLTATTSYVPVFSNSVITGGIIHLITDNLSGTYSIFQTRKGNENIVFDNISIYGDALTNSNNNNTSSQWGHGIHINGGKNITITNCYMTKCFGDGINLQVGSAGIEDLFPVNIKISNCTCNYNRRLGIAVEGGKNIIISNTTCRDNGKINRLVYPGSGIDIEPWREDNYIENLIISGCDLRDNREWSLADYSWSEGCTDIIISGSVLDSIMIKNQNNHTTTFNGCNFLGYAYVYDSIAIFNNCSMGYLLGLLEGNESPNSINCEINNCKLYYNEEDYSNYNYSPIFFRKQNLSPLSSTNNKLVIRNSIIETGPNIDTTKCYTLFSKSIGEGGGAVIELYNTEITNNKNISTTDFVDYFEDCKLTALSHGIRSREASKPMIFKRCTFITSTDEVIILGGTAKNYTHKVDPYDIQLLLCSFNPDKIYAESKSIDTYFELGYIYDGGKNYKVLIKDPIFPIGTVYSAYNLTMNSYYNIDWLMGDRDFSKTNIDNTSKSKVRYSLSNYLNDYIYRINEDIDLNSDTINIGSGCILDFSAGGKISNGTINLNNTLVLPLGLKIEDYISASITGNYREGQIVYDSALKKQKLWNGTEWVNLDGTALTEETI